MLGSISVEWDNSKVQARNPTIVLFDWDGTLFDSGAASLRAFRKSLGDFDIAFTDAQYKAAYTPRWYRMYEAFGVPQDLWAQADQRWLHHYQGERPGLMQGASELLAALREQGILTGIVTNGTRPRIVRELAYLGLETAFRTVVCHEDVTHSKPHPEGVLTALALAGCLPADCWYVGDTPVDVEQGHCAGVYTVGVLTDYVDAARMEQSRPHLMLHNIMELPEALYRFTSTTSSKMPGGS
jgi:HAD superfamily hydrolase (TIGR01509 family)